MINAVISAEEMCYDRHGSVPTNIHNLRSCTLCYAYLFPIGKSLVPMGLNYEYLGPRMDSAMINISTTDLEQYQTVTNPIMSDIQNETNWRTICSTLNDDECTRWKSCCISAIKCCHSQLKMPEEIPIGYCHRTWDGYSCWKDTPPDTYEYTQCPDFIEHSIATRKAIKECLNGTWFMKNGLEWTDYTPCLDVQGYIVGVYIAVACSAISIALLLPSVIIFLIFRDLLKQHRVKLHINFFISLMLNGTISILWYMLVHHDLLIKPSTEAVMYLNPVWCRVISWMKIYLTSTSYFWMFCEGYYLHRLIANAFEPPKNLIFLYVIGWGLPLIPALVYSVIRAVIANESCWAKSVGYYQWIIYIPNLFCLVVNMIFLCNILKILIFQMHAHPHEPSNFRKGLKAAFMLIPLFGLQLILTIYRPEPTATWIKEYEYATFIITNSQGIVVALLFCLLNKEGVFVSLIFCFFNGEVISHLRNSIPCLRKYYLTHKRSRCASTAITQFTTCDDPPRRSPTGSVRSKTSASPKAGRYFMNGDTYEMEEYKKSNGLASKNNQSLRTKGEYMQLPVGATTESNSLL